MRGFWKVEMYQKLIGKQNMRGSFSSELSITLNKHTVYITMKKANIQN